MKLNKQKYNFNIGKNWLTLILVEADLMYPELLL